MIAERILHGIGVSAGIVVAPLFILPDPARKDRLAGSRAEERDALGRAIADAAVELCALMERVGEEEAAILEFQSVLLEDEDLLDPIHEAIDTGAAAHRAWSEALDREIRIYQDDDCVFAARASDLADLRDRVLRHMFGGGVAPMPDERSIVVARDLPPSRLLEMDGALVAGLALGEGSRTSHVSLLARAKGVPLVVGLGDIPDAAENTEAVLDAATGSLILHPSKSTRAAASVQAQELATKNARARVLASEPAITADGEPVAVLINVDHPSVLDDIDPSFCDGIGLTRTEFLFEGGPPSEDGQLVSYRRLIDWAAGRSVTIRTLDAGGDKPIAGVTIDGETNPFLGVRGVRLSLRSPDLFKVQLRALLRAAAAGPIKVMVPMVTLPAELEAVRALVDAAAAELAREGIAFARPPLGIMVEVPATALAADAFDADFYSIGTNDLVQYATACARDNAAVAALARADHPGVVGLIESAVDAGRRRGVEVSVCGDLASDEEGVATLLSAGVRTLSVAPSRIGAVKAAIAAFAVGDAR